MNDISFKIGLSYGWGLYFSSVRNSCLRTIVFDSDRFTVTVCKIHIITFVIKTVHFTAIMFK